MGADPPTVTGPTLTPRDFLRDFMRSFYPGGRIRPTVSHNGSMADRIVYSTGAGTLCPNCRRALRECVCPKGAPGVPIRPGVRVGREVQGRGGKGVTTITGLPLAPGDLEALATRLKKRCGSGGTVRAGVIEIQGDHRDAIVAELTKLGWPAKRSGG